MSYTGWMLPDAERQRVLELFPPRFADAKATHITLDMDSNDIPVDADIEIIGYSTDDQGIEALVCRVFGELHRPDGSVYHLTLSLADGRAAKETNDVIAHYGYQEFDSSIPIKARGFVNRGGAYVTTPLSA